MNSTMTQQKQYRAFLESCLTPPDAIDSITPVFEKLKKDDIARFNEAEALRGGAFREAIVEKGHGKDRPKEGDLVYFHFSIYPLNDDSKVIYSTRPEMAKATGAPIAVVLNKSPRLPRGWELALSEMNQSERRILQIKPEFGFLHEDCQYHLPADFKESEGEELSVDIQLIHWYPSKEVLTVATSSTQCLLKRTVEDGDGFENLRELYKAQVCVCVRKAASNGVQGTGEVLFGSMTDPLDLTMGDTAIPPGLSACLGTMVKNEHSFCTVERTEFPFSEDSLIPELPADLQQVEVEIKILRVIQVRDLYGDGKVMKHRLIDGEGIFPSDCPMQDCKVQIHYKARPLMDPSEQESLPWVFDTHSLGSDPISVELGCGVLPFGLEGCVHLMLPGEISLAKCKAEMAYDHVNTRCAIPEGLSKTNDVEFEIELINFTKSIAWRGISTEESIKEAQKSKSIANDLYKAGAVELASNKYKTIIKQMTSLRDFESDEQIKEADELTLACYSNLAACSIYQRDYPEAIEWCNKSLKLNDQNAKVLLRRAKAYSLKGDFEQAELDLNEVLQIDETFASDVEEAKRNNKQRKIAAAKKQRETIGSFLDRN